MKTKDVKNGATWVEDQLFALNTTGMRLDTVQLDQIFHTRLISAC